MAKVTREEWCIAVLYALGDGGLRAVSVEGLARRLGVTKGSFYWHFKNRNSLLEAALALWEAMGTVAVIARLDALPDPLDRLNGLFASSLDDLVKLRTEAVLMGAAADGHPLIAPVFSRVNSVRLAYLESLYAALGVAEPETWARLAYASFLGGVQLAAMQPSPLRAADGPALIALLQQRMIPNGDRP